MSDYETVPAAGGTTVNLSLISHTNVGKTTLARTLLGRDIGEVRDEAHVTDISTGYVLVQNGADTLMLWDTPGFGDTARLLSRLRMAGNPIGWFLSQVWDRFRERPLWSSQQAVKNAREEADVILYMVNAAEDPAAARYVQLEMEVLGWIGKPVALLLNQMGAPRADNAREIDLWRDAVGSDLVRAVLPLDAFARCWVQEGVLLETIAPLLPPAKAPAMAGLTARWHALNAARFAKSMAVLGRFMAQATADREPVDEPGWRDKLVQSLAGARGGSGEVRRAMKALAGRLSDETARSTEELIRLHALTGNAARKVMDRVASDYAHAAPTPEGPAAALGGLVSGAVGGLAADLAAGGLTLGGGMIVGGILGALGATGVAKGVNMARGEDNSTLGWSEEFTQQLAVSALLRYLAVAHFGRGRGDWSEGEHPPFWPEMVQREVAAHESELRALRRSASRGADTDSAAGFTAFLQARAEALLARLYPAAAHLVRAADAVSESERALVEPAGEPHGERDQRRHEDQ